MLEIDLSSPHGGSCASSGGADQAPGQDRDRWRRSVVLFLLLLLSFGYFNHMKPGWNVNTRLALTFAIAERGTFSIDAYHDNPSMPYLQTNDKAYYDGHFYCDKNPGLSFLAAPLYWLFWQAKMQGGLLAGMHQSYWVYWSRWVVRTLTVSVSAALLGVLLLRVAQRLGCKGSESFALGFVLLCGTVLAGYATLFFPYLPASCSLVGAWYVLQGLRLRGGPALSAVTRRRYWTTAVLAGFLTGMSALLEFTSGLAMVGIGAYAVWTFRRKPAPLLGFAAGACVPLAMLFAYTFRIFGELTIPYRYEYDDFFREAMAEGFMGIHAPRLAPLYYITVHPFQGLFFYSPVLLLSIPGFFLGVRRFTRHRFGPDVVLALWVFVSYLAFNAGYYMWWGGWASLPRHLCIMTPFLIVPLAFAFRASRTLRGAGAVLGALSVVLVLMIVAVEPQSPPGYEQTELMQARITDNLESPVLTSLYPRFFRGELAWNLGILWFGLKGLVSLLPLLALWAVGLWAGLREGRSATGRAEDSGSPGAPFGVA